MNDVYAYDVECYPNVFTIGIVRIDNGARWIFEISDRINQVADLIRFIYRLRDSGCRMLGFNNERYDYPLLHHVISLFEQFGTVTAAQIFEKSDAMIKAAWTDWTHSVSPWKRIIPQIDVFKIMHFDNVARATSLKKLEMASRSSSVEDLPFKPGVALHPDQIDPLITYMCWDINETVKFAKEIAERIAFRDDLTARYGRDMTNFNDTRIGKDHFTAELENAGVECFTRDANRRRQPRQTPRIEGIRVVDKLMSVPLQTPQLQQMWQFFAGSVIPPDKTKGFFTDLHASLGEFTMHFGAGGIHGSVAKRSFYTNNTHEIIDVDVTSYYPSLAIVNGFYPEHLGTEFCAIYAELKRERLKYPKTAPESAMLKLALNGVYGDSNNKHSPFYDPAYTMAITINGQLLLAWLAEMLTTIPDLELIQINTDGVTVHCPRQHRAQLEQISQHWQYHTGLELEAAVYRSMHVRDVNNYVAVFTDDKPTGLIDGALKWEHKPGTIKRKNAYLTKPDWHQNHSSLVIPKAVDAFLQHGTRPDEYIFAHDDPFDFMRHIKVPKSSRLMWGDDQVQNNSRYFIALAGKPLVKVMPSTDGSDQERLIGADVGWSTQMCNDVRQFDWANLNRRWYVKEAEKLIAGLGLSC